MSQDMATPATPRADRAFAAFQAEIDAQLDRLVPRNGPAALLQFPYDCNAGNHMMWVAATDYLESRAIRLAYVAHGNNCDVRALRRAIGGGPILFLGGVTVSRLWPRHAEVKRQIAAAFPDNPLVSLPATMLFVDEQDRQEAGRTFGAHRNVTMMARSPVSEAQGRLAFSPPVRVVTVPDLSLRLPPQPRRRPPQHDVIWLARNDVEGTGFALPDSVYSFDWPADVRSIRRMYLMLRASGPLSRLRSSALGPAVDWASGPAMAGLYRRASLEALAFGNATLDLGRVLVTDRMHPHVLAALRRQHVVLLPDRFGKNRGVYEHYTRDMETVHWADTPERALSLARDLAALP